MRGTITGIVQGVGFRWSMQREAQGRGIRGWVCNRADGAVEFAAVGPASAVDELLSWASSGPPSARVDSVDVAEVSADEGGPGSGFDVTRC